MIADGFRVAAAPSFNVEKLGATFARVEITRAVTLSG